YLSLRLIIYSPMTLPPRRTTIFPYTTLFRSEKYLHKVRYYAEFYRLAVLFLAVHRRKCVRLVPLFTSSNVILLPDSFGHSAERRAEEHTSELQSRENLVCRLLLEKKKKRKSS